MLKRTKLKLKKPKSKERKKLKTALILMTLTAFTSCSTSMQKRDKKIIKVLKKQNELIETIRKNYDEITVGEDKYLKDDLDVKKVPIDESLMSIIESNDVIIDKL